MFLLSGFARAADNPGAGIALGATRVIYNEKAGAAALRLINTSSTPFLIQSWVDNYKGEGSTTVNITSNTFSVTPPLFRLDKGENSIRIQRISGNMPTDRESVYQLKVKIIPSSNKPADGTNYVQFAFVNGVKLFWRPVGLKGDANEAYKEIKFKHQTGKLIATNPTPYHITVKILTVGGKEIKSPDQRMIPPFGEQNWPSPVAGNVTYSVVNDFGALTKPLTVTL